MPERHLLLHLVRHGETEMNRQAKMQGWSDAPLNERGAAHARLLAQRFLGQTLLAVYSSPLRRALETARAIAEPHGLEAQALDGLMEIDMGEMDGLVWTELHQHFPQTMERWQEDPSQVRLPGGETLPQLQERAWSVVDGILQRYERGDVVVVSHAFTVVALLCRALEVPLSRFRSFKVDLGAVSTLEFHQYGTRLVGLNDRCHLTGPGA